MISVITPAQKADWCIKRMLDSVANQTTPPDEVLIGVDCCDKTWQAVERIKDNYSFPVKTYYFQPHAGCYRIRNTLACMASGDTLVLFDADDEMNTDYIEQMTKLTTHGHATCPRYTNYHQNGSIVEVKQPADGCPTIMRHDVIANMGWEPWECGADSEFNERSMRAGMVYHYTAYPVMIRHVHGNNLTQRADTAMKSKYRKEIRETINQRRGTQYRRDCMAIAPTRMEYAEAITLMVPLPDDDDRLKVWAYCRAWWVRKYPDWQIWEQSAFRVDGLYHKARTVNEGFAHAGGSIVVMADADCIPASKQQMDDAIQAIRDGSGFAMPHRMVRRLDQASTLRILQGEGEPYKEGVGIMCEKKPYQGTPFGGIFAASKTAWNSTNGGLDESFVGWGGEDQDMYDRNQNIKIGYGDLIHLWHSPQPRKGDTYQANFRRIQSKQKVASRSDSISTHQKYQKPDNQRQSRQKQYVWVGNRRVQVDEM